jgi:3-hydroxymyristoyl/3-hydroxydecanoyl-(acyl carrier protein) dehydratase
MQRLAIGRSLQPHDGPAWIGILNARGLRDLRCNGHEAVAAACAPDFPAARVRFVDQAYAGVLERGGDAELDALFASPLPERPRVTERRGDPPVVAVYGLRVPPDLCCLKGHFPELPLVPGAILLGWAMEFGAESLGTSLSLRAMRSIKFERIVQPGQSLRLRIVAEPVSSTLRFEYLSEAGRHSSGQIEVA